MKIKFGSIVTDGRGKLGGQVYARNRSGAYVRNKVTPNNPQTVFQSAIRALLATFSEAWRGLTQAQRNAWNAAVENFPGTNQFGDEVIPTGKNLYTRLNVNLSEIGESAIDTPPTPAEIVEPSDIDLEIDNNPNVLLDFTGSTDMTYKVFLTANLSPGIGFFKNKFKLIDTIAPPNGTPADLTTAYADRLGNPIAGQKVAVKVVPVVTATGQKGVGLTASEIVVDNP